MSSGSAPIGRAAPAELAAALVALVVAAVIAVVVVVKPDPPRNLRSGLFGAEAFELVAPPGALLDAARRLAPALARARGVEARVLPEDEAGSARCARVVIGTLASERAAALAKVLGVEPLDPGDPAAGFRFSGREYTGPGDLLGATLPDPERPGRPATLYLGANADGLARHLARLDPGWRPSFRTFRAGEPERDGPLAMAPDGANFAPRETDVVRRDQRAAVRRAALIRHPVPGLRALVPPDTDLARVTAYLPVAREARRRAAKALGVALEELHTPQVVLYDDAEEMERVLGAVDLSLVNRVALAAHVLLAPGVPDDGGGALARLAALELLGPPEEEALLLGFGAWAAESWFGAPLAHWPAHLGRVDGSPGEIAPLDHLAVPFFAALVEDLLSGGGTERLRAAWSLGRSDLLELADEERLVLRAAAWQERMTSLAPERRERLARLELGVGVVWTRGASGYGGTAALASIARAAEAGLSSVAIPVFAWPANDPPALPDGRMLRRPARNVGDVELLVAASRARAAGLKVVLSGHLLTSPSGSWYGERPFTTNLDAWAEFFDQLAWLAADLVLLSEVVDAELVVVAEALPDVTRTTALPDESPTLELVRGARVSGWNRVVGLAAGELGGRITYAARESEEARRTDLYAELGVFAEGLLEPLVGSTIGELRIELAGRLGGLGERAAVQGLPAIVVGAGFPATSEARSGPRVPRGATDPREQARLIAALLAARQHALDSGVDLSGILLSSWSSDPRAVGTAVSAYELQNGPAEDVLRSWSEEP